MAATLLCQMPYIESWSEELLPLREKKKHKYSWNVILPTETPSVSRIRAALSNFNRTILNSRIL